MLSIDEGSALANQPQVEMVRSIGRENALQTELMPRWSSPADLEFGVQILPNPLVPTAAWISTAFSGAKINERSTGPSVASPASNWAQGIRTEMRDLRSTTQSEIAALSAAVMSLTQAVSAMQSAPGPSSENWSAPLSVVAPASGAMTDDDLSEALDQLADGAMGWSESWARLAMSGLNDEEDSSLRAAAGRALATHAPEIAVEMLPRRIEKEKNRFVRAILRSSLGALTA